MVVVVVVVMKPEATGVIAPAGARRDNAVKGVTGVLTVHGSFFAQCLAGPKAEVEELFGRIERDRRHDGVTVLLEQRVPEHTFGEWSMGCTRLTESESLRLATAQWEVAKRQHSEAGAYSPGFVLLQTLWEEHKQTAAV